MAERHEPAGRWYRFDPRKPILIAVVAVTMLYLLLIPTSVIDESERLGSTEVILIAVILAVASNLPERLTELRLGGFSATFQELRRRQETLEDQVGMLSVILGGMLTYFEYEKLHFLAHGQPFMVRYAPRMMDELYHLDALRYIKVLTPSGLQRIVDDHQGSGAEFDLKQYVAITDRGRAYLEFREKYVQATADEDWGRRVLRVEAQHGESNDPAEGTGSAR